MTITAAQALASFAAGLRYSDLPDNVSEFAKDCLIDTVAAATYGSAFPWSQAVMEYAQRYGTGGGSELLGAQTLRVQAPFAALANGTFAHAFELDSIREPSAGVHAGATIAPAVFAVAQECAADGRSILSAFVAGCEVASRIGVASHHSPEKLGFHAPGMTGPFGAAVAAGLLLGLDEDRLTNAIGIAGSLTSGLMTFSKSRQGSMVKRLHPGRAAESGVLAARLAAAGFEGPETTLDGPLGFLDVYCHNLPQEASALTAALGEDWETLRTGLKRYACHANAQTAVGSVRELVAKHRFSPEDVSELHLEVHERSIGRHDNREPADVMQAQYSVPFCVALALHRDPIDPRAFSAASVADPEIRASCRQVSVEKMAAQSVRHTRLTVRLRDGTELVRDREHYKGMPADPLSREELREKYDALTQRLDDARAERLFERLISLEMCEQLSFS